MPRGLVAGVILLFGGRSGWAQGVGDGRNFRQSDGLADSYCASVSVSPRGNVWVKHSDADAVSVFSGYAINTLPSPGKNNYRVYESQSGQLWSLSNEGLLIYGGQKWTEHPIPEIRAEIRSDPLRQVRQISIVPADRDHAFVLLSRELLEYDALHRRTTVLRTAQTTRLGRLIDMTRGPEESLWISGAAGLARVAGPLRTISMETHWEEFLAPAELGLENFQRPFANAAGVVTAAAFYRNRPSRRAIVEFDGKQWHDQPVGDELIKQAWTDWEGDQWCYTINSLLRVSGGATTKANLWVGQVKDVACQPDGVFWLATSDGLFRYGPPLWETPAAARDLSSAAHAALATPEGEVWFAANRGLVRLREGRWEQFPWPAGYEAEFELTDRLFRLPSGWLAAAGQTPLLFDPKRRQFRAVDFAGGRVRFAGQSSDGRLFAQISDAQGNWTGVDYFDGDQFQPFEPAKKILDLGELYFLIEIRPGEVWASGADGLAVLNRGRWRRFSRESGFISERIFCMADAGENRRWFGGSARIQEFDGMNWRTIASGFSRVNRLIRSRAGAVWAATLDGAYGLKNDVWIQHSIEEGLPSGTAYDLAEDRDGGIWAGTTLGVARYHPEADRDPPRVMAPEIERSPRAGGAAKVTLYFRGTDKWQATRADRLLYSYRLDEAPWPAYTNQLLKVYGRLAAGEHRFQVRVMDRNWNASAETAALEFAVALPWYQEKRLLVVIAFGLALVIALASVAVNRHLQLKRSYAEVGRMVALRTRELERANAELLHSQKMRALGTLAAGIAHDFNNLLSIIKGSAQIIEKNLDDQQKIKTRLSRIKTMVEQGAGIVQSMLGLSRASPSDIGSCSLNAIAEETVRLLSDRFPEEIRARLCLAPELPPARGIEELIRQMLVNLILNAIDASGSHGEIIVRTGRWSRGLGNLALAPAAAAAYLFVQVQDRGHGISPEILPRIFEPFFTTKSFSTRRGTGLGLSMVYELAKQMGFGLAVESAPGAGSIFSILVPALAAER